MTDHMTNTDTSLAAELAALQDHARKMSIALTNLSGGGSEMFTRIGEDFYADPEACLARLAEKQANRDRRAALTKPAVPDVREAIVSGLEVFCRNEPDFDMSYGMRQVAADHILARPQLFAALTQSPTCCEAEREQSMCQVPPEGWYCTRKPGHDGPCAALPIDPLVPLIRNWLMSEEYPVTKWEIDFATAIRGADQ